MGNNGQQWTTMDNNGQQWIIMDTNGEQLTTKNKKGQQWTTIRGATCISDSIETLNAAYLYKSNPSRRAVDGLC